MKTAASVKTTRQRTRTPLRQKSGSVRQRPNLRLQDRNERLSRSRRGGAWAYAIFSTVLTTAGVALFVSCVCSLAGAVMLEKTRRSSIETTKRIAHETGAVQELKTEIALAGGIDALDTWAAAHSFIPMNAVDAPQVPDTAPFKASKTYVARR